MDGGGDVRRLVPYVPRLALHWLRGSPDVQHRQVDGSLVFADVSGFTALSERLASVGREGAEQLTDVIDSTFTALLGNVYREGGQLVSFGGDAVLLLFEGDEHARRAVRSAVGLRRDLRRLGPVRVPGRSVTLRVSQGVHSGEIDLFLVGRSTHRQLVLAGGAVSAVVEAEHAAGAGQVVMTQATASHVPVRCRGQELGRGWTVARSPGGSPPAPSFAAATDEVAALAAFAPEALAPVVADHIQGGGGSPEHRLCTVGFLQVGAMADDQVQHPGFVGRLVEVIEAVEQACVRFGVTLLTADVDVDATKLVLVTGAPRAADQDEQRLLLALREVLDQSPPLPVRAGVHRGTIYVGDVGPDHRRTYTVMGDVVNTAARLMARAAWSQLLATSDVVDRSRVAFEVTAIEPFAAKGKRELVHAVAVGARREAEPTTARPKLVGRRREQEVLQHALQRQLAGSGGLVEVEGEPGQGKTALLDAFVDDALAAQVTVVRVQADLHALMSPYHLAARILGLTLRAQEHEQLRDRVEQLWAGGASEDAPPWLPVLADLVPGAWPPSPVVAALADEARARVRGEVFSAVLDRACQDRPTLVVVEDTQWVDDASAQLLRVWLQAPRPLVVTSHRIDQGSMQGEGATRVRLAPLDAAAAQEVVREVLGRDLPPALSDEVVQRAGGNPLFLRELALAVGASDGVEVLPESLESVLSLRLDQLGPRDRDLVRRAAVLGPRFRESDVVAVLGPSTSVPGPASWARVSEFVQRDGDELAFGHALLRDTAYASLPFRLRRQLHAEVADVWSADPTRGDPAVLSFHYFAAGRWQEAWMNARRAGESALQSYAPREAASLLQRALDAARRSAVPAAERAEVALTLARAQERSGSFDAADRTYASVAAGADQPLLRARSKVQMAWLAERQSRLRLGVRRARSALRTLESVPHGTAGRESLVAAALTAEGTCWEVAGRHDRAVTALTRAVEVGEACGDSATVAHAGSILDWALAMSGHGAQAHHLEHSLDLYRELGDLSGEATCLTNLGALAYLRGEWSVAVAYYRQGQEVQERIGDVTSAALGAANVGEVLSDQGHWGAAVRALDEALSVWRATGHRHGVAWASGLRGRARSRAGDRTGVAELATALALHREVGAVADAAQCATWLAEAQLLFGDLTAASVTLQHGDDSLARARVSASLQTLQEPPGGAARAVFADLAERARSEADRFELACVDAAWSGLAGPPPPGVSAAAAEAREQLGIVALAVLPHPASGAVPSRG